MNRINVRNQIYDSNWNIFNKKKLVDDYPLKANMSFHNTEDRELGKLFIRKYQEDKQYSAMAFFIAEKMGIKIQRLKNPTKTVRSSISCNNHLEGVPGMGDLNREIKNIERKKKNIRIKENLAKFLHPTI